MRRRQLEQLNLNGVYWRTPDLFEDGGALFEAMCERELEGIVAKRLDSRYIPGYPRLDEDQEPELLAVRARA